MTITIALITSHKGKDYDHVKGRRRFTWKSGIGYRWWQRDRARLRAANVPLWRSCNYVPCDKSSGHHVYALHGPGFGSLRCDSERDLSRRDLNADAGRLCDENGH